MGPARADSAGPKPMPMMKKGGECLLAAFANVPMVCAVTWQNQRADGLMEMMTMRSIRCVVFGISVVLAVIGYAWG